MSKNVSQPPPLTTLTVVLDKAIKDGYTENFKATTTGLESLGTEKKYAPAELQIVDFYRFEGASDPGDNSVLYIIEAKDGAKGTLVDSYGAYSDENVDRIVKAIPTIEKQA